MVELKMTLQQDWTRFPGFNFSPTDEQIVENLRRLVYGKISVSQVSSVIKEFDVYSTEPWNLPRDFFWYRNEESDIYFFTPKHQTSQCSKRSNRSAGHGFWDVNTEDLDIKIGSEIVGHKASLNFKLIKAGEKIEGEWIMYEYRLSKLNSISTRDTTFEDFVLCKIHRKMSRSNKDTIKRTEEETEEEEEEIEEEEEDTEDVFVEEERMAKKSRAEEDQTLPVSFVD